MGFYGNSLAFFWMSMHAYCMHLFSCFSVKKIRGLIDELYAEEAYDCYYQTEIIPFR